MRKFAAALVAAALALPATGALAAWNVQGKAVPSAVAARLPAGHRPSVSGGGEGDGGEGRTVTWQASYLPNGDEVGAYRVDRVPATAATTQLCEVPAPVHSCADAGSAGAAAYTVTPLVGGWTGPASPASAPAPGPSDDPRSHPSPTPTPTPTPTPSPTPTPTPRPSPSPSHDDRG